MKLIRMKRFCALLPGIAICMFMVFSTVHASIDDNFIKGYATAVLEREFNITLSFMKVESGIISLRAEDIDETSRDEIIAVLSDIKGVVRVEIIQPGQEKAEYADVTDIHRTKEPYKQVSAEPDVSAGDSGTKEYKRLFAPLIADPRWPHFSATYQSYTDDRELKNVFAASFGEVIPVYRDKAPFGGQWEIGIPAAAFIIHDLDASSWDLINEDYYAGLQLSYRDEAFSGIFRIFHNSSHVGDELLLRKNIERVNYSYEALDTVLSYDLREWLRIYGGGGYLFSRSPSDLKPWVTQYGFELTNLRTYFGDMVRPVMAADIKNRQENRWHSEVSLRLGIKTETRMTVGHAFQIMLEYFNGNSPNGQFHETLIEYWGIGGHFYF